MISEFRSDFHDNLHKFSKTYYLHFLSEEFRLLGSGSQGHPLFAYSQTLRLLGFGPQGHLVFGSQTLRLLNNNKILCNFDRKEPPLLLYNTVRHFRIMRCVYYIKQRTNQSCFDYCSDMAAQLSCFPGEAAGYLSRTVTYKCSAVYCFPIPVSQRLLV